MSKMFSCNNQNFKIESYQFRSPLGHSCSDHCVRGLEPGEECARVSTEVDLTGLNCIAFPPALLLLQHFLSDQCLLTSQGLTLCTSCSLGFHVFSSSSTQDDVGPLKSHKKLI